MSDGLADLFINAESATADIAALADLLSRADRCCEVPDYVHRIAFMISRRGELAPLVAG